MDHQHIHIALVHEVVVNHTVSYDAPRRFRHITLARFYPFANELRARGIMRDDGVEADQEVTIDSQRFANLNLYGRQTSIGDYFRACYERVSFSTPRCYDELCIFAAIYLRLFRVTAPM